MDSNSRINKIEIELVRLIILESANEDITGLYEAIHLNLYKKSWKKNDEELLSKIHWIEILNQDKSWEPPTDDRLYYCFLETQSTYEEAQRQYEKYKSKL